MIQRLTYIDALRGFAALFVLVFHIIFVPNPHLAYPAILHPVLDLGGSGVTLFFIVSAFTLCLTLENRTTEKNWILKFYFRRAGRILPLYYIWLIVMALATFGYAHIAYHKTELASLLFFSYNFQPGLQEGLVWASWTLGVEMVFYLMFPFIFLGAANLNKTILWFIGALLLSYFHYRYTSNIVNYKFQLGLLHQLPVFFLGMITFRVHQRYAEMIADKKKWSIIFAIGFVLLFATASCFRWVFDLYVLAIAYSCLLLSLSLMRIKILVNKFTVFLGTISYSLYLNHPRIIVFLTPIYTKVYAYDMPLIFKFLFCVVLTIAPIVIISYVTYLLIEKPGAKLIKYISKLVFGKIGIKSQISR